MTMTTTIPDVLFATCVSSYRDGAKSSVLTASEDEAGRENHPVWDAGITGTFTCYAELRPSSRIKTIASQGAYFGWSKNGYDVGAWIDGSPHSGAFNGSEWTWKKEERDYLVALLATRGEFCEWAEQLLAAHS